MVPILKALRSSEKFGFIGKAKFYTRRFLSSQLDRQSAGESQLRNPSLEQLRSRGDNRETVVILGSGWAGYTLARQLDHRKYHAIVVSPRSYFVFTPLLASTAVGTLEFRTALEPVRSKGAKAAYVQGWADSVDLFNKKLTIEEAVNDPHLGLALTGSRHVLASKDGDGEERSAVKGKVFELSYDKLVVAVGCYSQTFGVPGVSEHALFLKDIGDARRIRKRVLACFETAALPTTDDGLRKHLLSFAIVGGGPTGIEFSAELHDFITEDLAKLYPELMKYCQITVYDIAPTVLPMFDEKLGLYAMRQFSRENIKIKTSHRIRQLRRGVPESDQGKFDPKDEKRCLTLNIREEGEVGVGMVVWSTGLMMNPFVQEALGKSQQVAEKDLAEMSTGPIGVGEHAWLIKKHPRTGAVVTDNHLRVILESQSEKHKDYKAVAKDVFALGDCATIEGTNFPATAQVASQKAEWLAKMFNKGNVETHEFYWRNMGIMAYLGNSKAIFQSNGGGNVSGRSAWFIWRGVYLLKSVSMKNKILIPIYWLLNWAFGRDISRF